MNTKFQNEQTLLQQLRNSGDPASVRRADELQRLYHARQMALLSTDVYAAAKGSGEPPTGWTRVSEHPKLVQQIASQLHLSGEQFLELLKPLRSGFRAEIYLPDPAVLSPGYKPTVSFKGSTGEVLTANGLRDTSKEDFLANNFPQSIGMETNYYDHAMDLAWQLQSNGLQVENTGHSLGGGLASAASAISGVPATTFNAAGLHPLTAKRFAEQNELPVYDVQQHITAYHVQGELLNDGIQNNLHTLDESRRAQLAQVLGDAARVLHALPAAREPLLRKLNADLPEYAQAAVNTFIDRLATGDAVHLLRELPLAAGTPQPPLKAMSWGEHQPVARPDAMGLQEVTLLSQPLLEVVSQMEHGAERGAQVGRTLGVAADDMLLGAALQASGASFGGLPGPAITRMAEARLHQTPEQRAIDHHPTLTAATGVAGGLAAGLVELQAQFSPALVRLSRSLSHTADTKAVWSQGAAAGAEATERHGMVTMLPSLEARIQEAERTARMALPHTVEAPAVSQTLAPHAPAHGVTPPVVSPAPHTAVPNQDTLALIQAQLQDMQRQMEAMRRQREPVTATAPQESPTITRTPLAHPSAQREQESHPPAARIATATHETVSSQAQAAALAASLVAARARAEDERQHQDARRPADPRQETVREDTALWTSQPLPPPRVPSTFADPDHPKHYRYQTLLEQVQEAPALQRYTADQHARIAAGLTYVTDQRGEFIIQDLRAIDVQGNDLIVTDRLKIGQASNVVHGNLSFILSKTPEETASARREWALPKQSALAVTSQTTASADPQPVSPTDMRHPQEPHHAMFLDARRKLGAAYAHHGMTRDPEQLDREAARVTMTLRERQFNEVPSLHLACEPDGRFSTEPGLRAMDERFNMVKFSSEELKQAPPVEQSSQTLVQVEQRLHEQALAHQQQWAQQAGLGRTR